jgi:DegV family protein with EDD domain
MTEPDGPSPRGAARVGVVTDSTTDLPADIAERERIRVVPMTVTIGNESFISGVTLQADEFYRRLDAAATLPTTAQPNPHWFLEAWRDVADDGHEAAVSLHLSHKLSGTVGQARRLAPSSPVPVTVVDTGQVGGGLALMALAAARTAATGATSSEVVRAADRVGERVVSRVVVDTTEYMRRGGRVSGTRALVGRALRVKPILGVVDGALEPMGRARTSGRAFEAIARELADEFGAVPLTIVITHAVAPDTARLALDVLGASVQVQDHHVQQFGPVLGTHTGPGAVAVAAVPSSLVPGAA